MRARNRRSRRLIVAPWARREGSTGCFRAARRRAGKRRGSGDAPAACGTLRGARVAIGRDALCRVAAVDHRGRSATLHLTHSVVHPARSIFPIVDSTSVGVGHSPGGLAPRGSASHSTARWRRVEVRRMSARASEQRAKDVGLGLSRETARTIDSDQTASSSRVDSALS
jgi:hypothetical protein